MDEARFDLLKPETAHTDIERNQILGAAGIYLSPDHPISHVVPQKRESSVWPDLDSPTYWEDLGMCNPD